MATNQLRTQSELVAGYALVILAAGLVLGIFAIAYFARELAALLLLLIPAAVIAIAALRTYRRAIQVTFGDIVIVQGFWVTKQYPNILGWSWYASNELELRLGQPVATWKISATRKQVASLEQWLLPELFEIDIEPDQLDGETDEQNTHLLKEFRLQHYRSLISK